MIKVLTAHYLGDFKIALEFSTGSLGVFDGGKLLAREGALLVPLRDEAFFRRFYIDAGALAWPNGLELSPARLYEQTVDLQASH